MTGRPLPRVEIELRRWVPGWALRAAAVLVTAGTVILAAFESSADGGLVVTLCLVAAVAGGWAAWRPGYGPALFGAGFTALLLAFVHGDRLSVLWLAPLAYVGLRLCQWAAATGLTARVELAAFARSARTDGIVVAVTLLIGAVASQVSGGSFSGLVVGTAAVLALVLLVRGLKDGRP